MQHSGSDNSLIFYGLSSFIGQRPSPTASHIATVLSMPNNIKNGLKMSVWDVMKKKFYLFNNRHQGKEIINHPAEFNIEEIRKILLWKRDENHDDQILLKKR